MKSIGVVIATSFEASLVLKAFGFKRLRAGRYGATVNGHPVLLGISGVGKEAAWKTADRLCVEGAGELISAGFCGALVPGVNVGDLITERIATSETPVRNRVERDAVTERANAVAVDMETQSVIEAGTRRGVPIRVCRVVSDRYEDDMTPLFGTDATFSAWKIGLRLLSPKSWPIAAKLHRQSKVAKTRLVEELGTFLRTPVAP
jgi:nucleoside phosphorylase